VAAAPAQDDAPSHSPIYPDIHSPIVIFRKVNPNDLRHRFAQRLLVEKEINTRAVIQVGGWDSFQAIEPYLDAPTPDVANDAFEEAGLL